MPSSKSPTALQIGPGRLPANVVTSAALVGPSGSPTTPPETAPTLVSVVKTSTLTREAAEMFVLVDNRSRINAVAGSQLVDGETFTLTDGVNAATVFEFNSTGGVAGANVAVPFTGADSAATVANAIRTAINGVGGSLNVTAQVTIGEIVPLTQSNPIPIGIAETVAAAGFTFYPDPSNIAVYTIGLVAGQVGDVVHFVAEANQNNTIRVSGAAGIDGSSQGVFIGGAYGARSFIQVDTFGTLQTLVDQPGVEFVEAAQTLRRMGRESLVLVSTAAGDFTITLPQNPLIGDRITFIRNVAFSPTGAATSNTVTIQRNGASDLIDGKTSTALLAGAVTLVKVAHNTWITLCGAPAIFEVIDSLDLGAASASSARETRINVRTANGAWAGGTKTITLPPSGQNLVGSTITIADVDGSADVNPILISSGVLGVSNTVASTAYTISQRHGAVTLVAKNSTEWAILAESYGLVEDFTALSRIDGRPDAPTSFDNVISRLVPSPMLNWNQRKVALHTEFNGLITNILPVEGFSPGGSMSLSALAGVNGTIGVMRCSVPAGQSGYLHLGSLPTTSVFTLNQMLGFRAILTLSTANPGTDYGVCVGFGQDISDGTGTPFGTDGMFLTVGGGGALSLERVAASSPTTTSLSTSLSVSNRYVLEAYFNGTTWDGYINGVRHTTALTGVASVVLNFGLLVIAIGGASPYLVDVDSFTLFTLDLGATRHNP